MNIKREIVKNRKGSVLLITDYDKNKNIVYRKEFEYGHFHSFEEWNDYDEKGRLVFSENSNGETCAIDYSEDGKIVHSVTNDGCELWRYYNDEGDEIRTKFYRPKESSYYNMPVGITDLIHEYKFLEVDKPYNVLEED